MNYHFKVHKEGKGFWAECLELKGCCTQGSKTTLYKNMVEALNLYLSEPENSDLIFPEPKKIAKAKNIAEVPVDPSVAFAMQLRQIRHQRKLTQKDMMVLLEIKHLSNYQRLENPLKANPELKTLAEIKNRLPELEVTKIF